MSKILLLKVSDEIETEEKELTAVLTSPLSLDNDSGNDYRAPNLLQRVFSLLKTVRPGSDLTRFTLPAIFNIPKSQLQCYGESIYCVNNDILSSCANGETPLERFTSVVAWSISTVRPLMFGVAPYNPVLGETHHVSRGNLNVLLEQVSHHPPVSALHATNEQDNIEITMCQYAIPKFQGTCIETRVHGKRQLKLLSKGETYVMNSPNLVIKFLPVPDVEWLGNVTIKCQETGLEAHLCYKGNSFLGRKGNYRSIRGKIISSPDMKTIYEINGHWDRTVAIKDISNGKTTVIYRAKDVISSLKTPVVKDPKGLQASESAVVWAKVNEGILNKKWDKANEAKISIEENERELARNRMLKGETWVPKHFILSGSGSKETGDRDWEIKPRNLTLPPAPIIVPL
ncbi:putative oxysterol-binding protein [Helianthus annuus]|uniref:Oxysterol-binding protein n=1 Tax=Helianthus annuus TaxID=4232 RepID=A0A251TP23_HELAN|nr:oxysterol-binding protein-related protein 4C [Helianthus annuus]KAF5787605.1 putative oxysterol-binding protein [Helianthus annuus]KAJ0514817.1 putative oxysterol-binding protein [Helianthus annuus]KAJ0523123.1 putative oxysterol-binding protein [Helianthus annuus]KAJ0530982.1 putative oxysterol-binding protein [Helianthus annuus]KAJ0697837.1 putative oxysterol-binding protein [Helianthus annuus]